MSRAHVLIAGVGNVLLGDDGFGVEVVQRLLKEKVPEGVRVVDYGIRAMHLAYDLLDGYDTLVIVDALSRGAAPGTVFVFEPDLAAPDDGSSLDPHGLHPAAVLRMAVGLGAKLGTVRVVGCEPAEMEEHIGLTEPVERAIETAVRLVRELADVATRVTHKENDHVPKEPKLSV